MSVTPPSHWCCWLVNLCFRCIRYGVSGPGVDEGRLGKVIDYLD